MNDFQSGQALTAKDLNELKKLADGQNLPTDGEFIKSNGVNMWKSMNAQPYDINPKGGLELQVRYIYVPPATGQTEGKMVGFWFVKLGSGVFPYGTEWSQNQLYSWDICYDSKMAGSHFIDVSRVMTIYISAGGVRLNGTINYLPYIEDGTWPVPFDASKFLSQTPQVIDSDGTGWYNTGIPIPFDFGVEQGIGGIVYATLVRINPLPRTTVAVQEKYLTQSLHAMLVLSNAPIRSIDNLLDANKNPPKDYNGDDVTPTEIIGPSCCLAYAFTHQDEQQQTVAYDVHYTNDYPNLVIPEFLHWGEIRVVTGRNVSTGKLRETHYVNVPKIYFNNKMLRVQIEVEDGEEQPDYTISLDNIDEVWPMSNTGYMRAWIEVDPVYKNESSGEVSTKAFFKMDKTHEGEAIQNLFRTEYVEVSTFIQDLKDKDKEDGRIRIPLFVSTVNVDTTISPPVNRIIHTTYITTSIPHIDYTFPKHFDIVDGKVINCIAQIGANETIDCEDYEIEDMTKDIWLHITKSGSGEYDMYIDQEYEEKSEDQWSIILWKHDYPSGEDKQRYIDVRPGHISLGGSGEKGEGYDGCFEYKNDEGTISLLNPYYRIGGRTYTLNASLPSIPDNCILAVKVSATGGEQQAQYITYTGIADMQNDEQDYDYFIAPLYTFSGGEITCDWRKNTPILMTEY